MYQPGFDQGLAQIRYAYVLEQAAPERADRQARAATPKQTVHRLALTLAATAPIAALIVWMVVAH